MIKHYNKYILKNFIICFIKVTIVFSTVVIVMNLLEEINFFKNDSSENFLLPFFLTLLNMPSILFELFPFIFLISTLFFFIESIDNDELNVFKLYGVTNFKIIQILATLSFIIGVCIILFFYNISANLKFFYLDLKNQYTKDDKYLAIGGRVLNVIVTTENFKNSKDKAIKILNDLDWKGGFFRKDIAYKVT